MNRNQTYLTIRSSKKLPTPSRIALEVMQRCHNDNSGIDTIADIIQTDPALSSELLRYVNTGIASGKPVVSIRKAAVKVGLASLVNLALSFSLLSHHKAGRCTAFDYGKFWSTSLARAIAAKNIFISGSSYNGDEMFTCGLLANIGELALATAFPQQYADILIQCEGKQSCHAAEEELFGITSAELTTELLVDWRFPEEFTIACGIHSQDPDSDHNDEVSHIAKLLQLAETIAHICQHTTPQPVLLERIEQTAEEVGITPEAFSALFDLIVTEIQQYGEQFQIPVKPCFFYQEIKRHNVVNGQSNHKQQEPLKILVADDDPLAILNFVKLFSARGHEVFTAENGIEALQLCYDARPHMVITDWRMPKLSGVDLCKTLRNNTASQHIYIIMVTAIEDDDEIVHAFDAGADDYVVKPFTPKVLEARVRGGERVIRYQRMLQQDREIIQGYVEQLTSANRRLQAMAMTDPLTGLPNRRFGMERLNEAVKEASRHKEPLSCIMVDLDAFKKINDNYGHHCGDMVLKDIAAILLKAAREYDTICRMGGEEFLIISSRNSAENTHIFAERLRRDIESHPITFDDKVITITASFGVSEWQSNYATGEQLIKQADRAMYKAKQSGKNRVEVI